MKLGHAKSNNYIQTQLGKHQVQNRKKRNVDFTELENSQYELAPSQRHDATDAADQQS